MEGIMGRKRNSRERARKRGRERERQRERDRERDREREIEIQRKRDTFFPFYNKFVRTKMRPKNFVLKMVLKFCF